MLKLCENNEKVIIRKNRFYIGFIDKTTVAALQETDRTEYNM